MDTNSTNQVSQAPTPLESTRPGLDSFGSLFKASWQFFKANFKSLWSFFFLIGFLPVALQLVVQQTSTHVFSQFSGMNIAVIVLMVVFFLIGLSINIIINVLYVGAMKKINDLTLGQKEGAFATIGKILRLTFPILWAVIIAGLSVAVFAVLVFVVLMLPAAVMSWSAASLGVIYSSFIIMFIIMMVAFMEYATILMFTGASVVVENKRGVDATVAALWYSKGRKWEIFKRALLIGLVTLLIILVIGLVFGSIAIGIAYLKFGSVAAGFDAFVMFMMTNAGSSFTPPTDLFYQFALVWSLFESLVMSSVMGLAYSFFYKLWRNVKDISPALMSQEFVDKSRKKVKIFAWAGFAIVVVAIIIAMIVTPLIALQNAQQKAGAASQNQQMMLDQIRVEMEAQGIDLETQ